MKECLSCGKEIPNRNKYCNNVCQNDYSYKQYISRWKKGEEDGMSGKYQISNHIKRYLFEKYSNECSVCKWGELNIHSDNIPLEVEHIDGDYTNNVEENLTLLCPNCHSLTATYKGANKGKGRKDRKKYE